MGNKVRMKDIAEKIGVSIVSVSKAINGKDGVGDDVRKRILEVARELHYEINSDEKKPQNKTIGVVIADGFLSEKNSFYINIHNNIVKYASELNISVLLEIVTPIDEKNCTTPKIVSNKQIEGLVFLGFFEEEYINSINKDTIPYVFLDFYNNDKNIDAILSDSYNGSESLTNLLIANGHKDIRFVGTINLVSSITDRYLGYLKALIDNDLLLSSNITPIADRSAIGKGYREFEFESVPDAFVCSSDESAFYLMNYLKDKGYKIPQDISVVGFDDSYFADLASPQLTTYKVDIETMAEVTLRQLLLKIEQPTVKSGKTIIYGEVIERSSIAKK